MARPKPAVDPWYAFQSDLCKLLRLGPLGPFGPDQVPMTPDDAIVLMPETRKIELVDISYQLHELAERDPHLCAKIAMVLLATTEGVQVPLRQASRTLIALTWSPSDEKFGAITRECYAEYRAERRAKMTPEELAFDDYLESVRV